MLDSFPTPKSLLVRLRRPDDPVAWEAFVELYTPLLYVWVKRNLRRHADVEDVVQEILLQLYRKLPEFEYDPGRSFRGWLQTVARNVWLTWYRKRSSRPLPGDGGLDSVSEPAPLDELERAEYRETLLRQGQQVIRKDFQPTTWEAFELYKVEGRPLAEVAERTDLPRTLSTSLATAS